MNVFRCALGLALPLIAAALLFVWRTGPADGGEGFANPFFPYSVNVPPGTLRELGYAPIPNLYTAIRLDQDPPYDPNLKDRIRKMKGTDTVFWLTVMKSKAMDETKVVEIIRDLAAVAEEAGVQVSLYPHAGFHVAAARDALRLVKAVDRKNVGVTITLCHELMADNGDELPQIVDEVIGRLFVVTINGADKKPKGERMGWDRLIQPLGQGDFDVYGFLKKLKAAGFKGPIGLQCYGLKGDPVAHLTQSIKTWREYSARLAAE